jgi:NTP pyrophosphatase (non-canonical NTP hydrolase)
MSKKPQPNKAQILLFPSGQTQQLDTITIPTSGAVLNSIDPVNNGLIQGLDVVLSASYRRDGEGLKRAYEELQDLGCRVLSPSRIEPSREENGFVYMKGEESDTPERIELRHLEAIQKAVLIWLFAPEGYVGLSAALEVGFAHAQGIPVFCKTKVTDPTLRNFVITVNCPAEALSLIQNHALPAPSPSLTGFQSYYKRVASQRGYEKESAKDCLVLMVEEVGELARAVRRREKLVRYGAVDLSNEAQELADVFLYVVHMANILGMDLSSAVRGKERINAEKFAASR